MIREVRITVDREGMALPITLNPRLGIVLAPGLEQLYPMELSLIHAVMVVLKPFTDSFPKLPAQDSPDGGR